MNLIRVVAFPRFNSQLTGAKISIISELTNCVI